MGILISYSEAIIISVLVIAYCSWSWIMIHRQLRPEFNTARAKKVGSSLNPTNWPIIGMVPSYFIHGHRFHEQLTKLLQESGGTFELKGPWFTNLDTLLTCDPANVQHILVKNVPKYCKGANSKKAVHMFGHSFFAAEGKSWEVQRKAVGRMLNHQHFPQFVVQTSWKKVVGGLIPVLDQLAASTSSVVDFHDIVRRFTFDTMSMVASGHDPATLSVGLPENQCLDALDIIMAGFFHRHFLPPVLWKLQKWLQIGMEKNLSEASETVNEFLDLCIALKRERIRKKKQIQEKEEEEEEEGSHDLLTSLFTFTDDLMNCRLIGTNSKRLLRDMLFNMLVAGKETQSAAVTWLFWLLTKNPHEESKIRQEIMMKFSEHRGDENKDVASWCTFISNTEELKKLIYTRASLYEALRLFSPVAMQSKESVHEDTLPSGHHVGPGKRTVIAFYAMGRMESVWGADCLDFKPSRWITFMENGKAQIKNEPNHKFPVFSAGPTYCLGKDMAFNQMLMVAATIIHRYQIQVAEGQDHVSLKNSVVINLKNGFPVKVIKRHA